MSALGRFGLQPAAQDPQALAREILAQPRFRLDVRGAPAHTWWDALRDWLGARWDRLIDAFAHHVRIGGTAGVAIGDLLLVLAIGGAIVVLVRLLRTIAREASSSGAGFSIPLPAGADPALLHEEARQSAQRGAYALALALLFRAVLAALDARGLLRDDPARTVNECRRDVRTRAAALSGAFDCIARGFTAAVYAEDRVTPQQWNDAERAYREILAARSDAA
ncbi:MAG TPA: DUF4129 domain-containing protein [Candidatus Baltobacteraceae bacterium]|nr:DUF4129 domain-containing protein [Candidatus Baltobacteraceae bacterium]